MLRRLVTRPPFHAMPTMKTVVISILSTVLSALGAFAAAKWALPAEQVGELVTAIVGVAGAVFGLVAARHTPEVATPEIPVGAHGDQR